MYKNGENTMERLDESCCPREESLQSVVAETIELAAQCRGMSSSISNGLFGARVQKDIPVNDNNINCLIDAIKSIRATLRETRENLESIDVRL